MEDVEEGHRYLGIYLWHRGTSCGLRGPRFLKKHGVKGVNPFQTPPCLADAVIYEAIFKGHPQKWTKKVNIEVEFWSKMKKIKIHYFGSILIRGRCGDIFETQKLYFRPQRSPKALV